MSDFAEATTPMRSAAGSHGLVADATMEKVRVRDVELELEARGTPAVACVYVPSCPNIDTHV